MKFRLVHAVAALAVAAQPVIHRLAWAQASAPGIPFQSTHEAGTPGMQQWLLALLGCAALLALAVYLLRRLRSHIPMIGASVGKRVRVIERTSLAPNVQLVVIGYADRHLLLSVSATGATCLRDDEVAAPAQPATGGTN